MRIVPLIFGGFIAPASSSTESSHTPSEALRVVAAPPKSGALANAPQGSSFDVESQSARTLPEGDPTCSTVPIAPGSPLPSRPALLGEVGSVAAGSATKCRSPQSGAERSTFFHSGRRWSKVPFDDVSMWPRIVEKKSLSLQASIKSGCRRAIKYVSLRGVASRACSYCLPAALHTWCPAMVLSAGPGKAETACRHPTARVSTGYERPC